MDEIDGVPHVVVDGAPRPGTALTLSHWPGTPTPKTLWADVSAEIVLKALGRRGSFPSGVEVATLDHFDADGLLSLALLVADALAEAHGPLVAAAAHVGDFDVIEDRRAALLAFAVAALDHRGIGGALAVVPDIVVAPEKFEELWGPEAEAFDASCRLRDDGAIEIDERAGLDLAIVRIDGSHPAARVARWGDSAVHPGAVHSVTPCLRVATMSGHHYEVSYRYESWVRLASYRPRPRVDLAGLAVELQDIESDGASWHFDGAGALTPRLRRLDGGESTLSPEQFVAKLSEAFRVADAGPPAWDPYSLPVD